MYSKSYIYFVVVASFGFSAMSSPDVNEFFPGIKGNLSSITWAHAVNNKTLLDQTLRNNDIMMIEADIILGTLTNSTNNSSMPVMGHPPSNTSDLSLLDFLTTIDNFNNNATNTTTKKGVKLDFKSTTVFNASQSIVTSIYKGTYPLWLNADIIRGPINATTDPVDPNTFLSGSSKINNTVLSIGWTTNYGSNTTGKYTTDQINSILTSIRQNNVTQNVTFPVRAGLAAGSISEMKTLVTSVSKSTLTIWSSEGDNVNVTALRQLIAQIGVNKTFIDVPENLRKELRLDNLPSSASSLLPKIIVTCLVALAALIYKEL